MRVLVGCEFSGTVRESFTKLGHDAWSCDLIDSELPGKHIKGNLLDILSDEWDLAIFHPPCTYLAVCGAKYFSQRKELQRSALQFVKALMKAPIPRIALENPISVISSMVRKPDQIIQPWQFGHGETKATCLWLKNLPKLKPTNIVKERAHTIANMPPSSTRAMDRSRTFQGIAEAMADQWGRLDPKPNTLEDFITMRQ